VSRRQARELALQVLFHVDIGRAEPETALFEAFARARDGELENEPLTERDRAYARELVLGTWEHRDALDQIIAGYARDWKVDRMAGVDRNILRMAIYEIRHRDEVPDSVVAAEAVELAKRYSTDEAAKFINGILGSVIRNPKQEADRVEPTLPGH
jgi:N utilization substance protein B